MQAALITRLDGSFELGDVDIDTPRGAEVLVEVKAAGLCHSDFLVATLDRGRELPLVAGHEMAGVAVGLGPDVTDLEIGDHVVATEIDFCGRCAACRAGQPYRCQNPAAVRRPDGAPARLSSLTGTVNAFGVAGFAERTLLHQNKLVRIPKDVPFEKAAVLGCAVSTGMGAVLNTAAVRPGETVAVVGLGGIGLNAIQGAALAGARTIIGVDLQPSKLELATEKFGATHAFNAADDVATAVRELTGGGVDHVFEAIGLGVTQRQALELARVGGSVNLIGIPQGAPLEFSVMRDLLMTQRTLRGVYMGSSDPRRDIPFYADLYLQGRLNLDDLVASTVSLGEIGEAYARQEGGAIARTVVAL
ncbi:MAG: zinc-binding dehydrogenase [Arthrobacter sp.]|jgi:S-(hydroxymethyl)glutathione dehydrogenase/alcohol dehydrogenase|nr:zinc-binding dehydrogenase [Arthrobacter sp.]